MDLEQLLRRLEYELGSGREQQPILILDADGSQREVLSVSWSESEAHWVIVGDTDG